MFAFALLFAQVFCFLFPIINQFDEYFQLIQKNNPKENDLRKRWRILDLNNKKLEEAIKDCSVGPHDFDCSLIDYIRNKDDFTKRVDPKKSKTNEEIGIEHDAWVRSDVDHY